MKYLKWAIVIFFVLGFVLTVAALGWTPTSKAFVYISAGFFVVYVLLRFVFRYPDENKGALDGISLFVGAFSILVIIFTLF
jgi:hypothetical protein